MKNFLFLSAIFCLISTIFYQIREDYDIANNRLLVTAILLAAYFIVEAIQKIKTKKYRKINELIAMIDEPWGSKCKQILDDHIELFQTSRGSTHNHQTWDGGYIDHVTDGMNLMVHLYPFMCSFKRRIPFSLSDALLVFFLHDLEKPWRILVDQKGKASNRKDMSTKADFKKFREEKIKEYGIILTPDQQNAFTYIEGEIADYSSERRVMNELSAFCHMVDTWCARGWYDYPKVVSEDEWFGADRFRI